MWAPVYNQARGHVPRHEIIGRHHANVPRSLEQNHCTFPPLVVPTLADALHMQPPEVDINVTVMTSTFWPMSYAPAPCTFPPLLVRASKSFEQFYLSRHSGRKLAWQPSLGNADVRVTFKARQHDLNVSSFALVILLLFENLGEGDYLAYEDIKNATAIPDSELQRNLKSLACTKFKVLRKHPAGRDVNPEDSFSFNADFSSPLQKIKISTVRPRVESCEEHKETQDRVDEERRYQTDVRT